MALPKEKIVLCVFDCLPLVDYYFIDSWFPLFKVQSRFLSCVLVHYKSLNLQENLHGIRAEDNIL